eukprot:RCo003225
MGQSKDCFSEKMDAVVVWTHSAAQSQGSAQAFTLDPSFGVLFFSGVFSGVVFAEIVVSSLLHRDSEMLLRTYVSFCAKASVSDSGGCGFSPFILLVGTRRRLLQSSYPRITVRNRSELWF